MHVPELGPLVPARGGPVGRAIGRAGMGAIRWGFEGELPNEPKLVVLGAPHSSNFDFIIAMASLFSLGLDLRIMGKHTLFRWPLGSFMRYCGLIPIDRRAAHGVVGETVKAYNANDRLWIGIAPEGTRGNAGTVWKSGFWHIARQADVPIFPIAIDYGVNRVRFGPTLRATEDVRADMARLSQFYGGVPGARRTIPAAIDVR